MFASKTWALSYEFALELMFTICNYLVIMSVTEKWIPMQICVTMQMYKKVLAAKDIKKKVCSKCSLLLKNIGGVIPTNTLHTSHIQTVTEKNFAVFENSSKYFCEFFFHLDFF